MSKKKAARLDAEIAQVTGERDGWIRAKTSPQWPETWDKKIGGNWYTIEKQLGNRGRPA